MKIHELLLILFVMTVPSWALAGWQIVKPATVTKPTPVLKDQDPLPSVTPTAEVKTEVKKAPEKPVVKPRYLANQVSDASETSDQIYRPMPVPIAEKPVPTPVPYRHMKTYRSYLDKEHYRYPSRYAYIKPKTEFYAISISGSVKENFERIMRRYNWKVIWKAPYDYNYDGKITGSSLPNMIEKLFQPFPLQAIMYMSNRTITVVPRNKYIG